MERAFKRVLAAARAAKLPALEVSTSYGKPALKVGGVEASPQTIRVILSE